tara:strand:- start:102537 stop:103232 length:696 start_codon:yes stop_codon:yes gene_type:complete
MKKLKNNTVAFSVISKYPFSGDSKTRLAKDVGLESAGRLSECFLKDFLRRFEKNQVKESFVQTSLWITPYRKETQDYFKNLLSNTNVSFKIVEQPDITFFAKLAYIGESAYKEGLNWLFLTGSDIPDFPFEIFKDVSFKSNTVYIGPDIDNGFYFIALETKYFDLLNLKIENEETVLDSLVKRCQAGGIKVNVLKEWSDIDTIEDLKVTLSRNCPYELPHTYELTQNLFNG